MRLTYVTGPTCSGKTTLHERLVELRHPEAVELDNYALGLPAAAHVEWLRWRALEHLAAATSAAEGGATVGRHQVVTGIVWPFAVLGDPAMDAALDAGVDVRFVLLDRPWDDVRESTIRRLEAEGMAEDDITEQLVINNLQRRQLRRQIMATGQFSTIAVNLDQAAGLAGPSATW